MGRARRTGEAIRSGRDSIANVLYVSARTSSRKTISSNSGSQRAVPTRERSPLMEERSSQSIRMCAEEAGLRTDVATGFTRPAPDSAVALVDEVTTRNGTDVGRPPAMRDRTGSCGLQTTPQIDLTTSARGVAPMQGSRPFGVKTERKIGTATSDARRPSVPLAFSAKCMFRTEHIWVPRSL